MIRQSHDISAELVTNWREIESEWKALETTENASLHQSYDWCKNWCDANSSEMVVLLLKSHVKVIFLLPLEITHKFGMRIASFPGGSFNNLNTGLFPSLVDALTSINFDASELKAIIEKSLKGHADILSLQNIPANWRGESNLLSPLFNLTNSNRSYQLPYLENFDETLKQINSKTRRKKFRQQSRRGIELGGYSHYTPLDLKSQENLLHTFFKQKAERFSYQGVPDAFENKDVQNFLRALLKSSDGSQNDYPLRLHALIVHEESGDKVAAVTGLSRKGQHIICQFGSISTELPPELSPGELLFWHVIEQAQEQGAALFDFGVGDQRYKMSWCPQVTELNDIYLPISQKGKMLSILLFAARKLKLKIKKLPFIHKMVQRIRRTIKL